MSSWNYRQVKDGNHYGIHEVYYDKYGKIEAITENPCTPYGESKDELFKDLDFMLGALSKPVVDMETMK